jgi:hypothetical protein
MTESRLLVSAILLGVVGPKVFDEGLLPLFYAARGFT